MLKDDHKAVEKLFKRFEKAGDNAYVEKREVADRIVEELSRHAAIEEQLFYPVARATVPDTDDIVLESLEEHHVVKWVLSEIDKMDPRDERFDAKVTVLIESVRHHVEEEENEFFPKVRDELGRNALNDLGDAMAKAKAVAPTHPHPRSPDTPPGNLVVGTTAGVVDRLGDTMSGLAQGGVTALGDLIALILRRKRPSVSPRGSKVARTAATEVRSAASSVTESAIEAVSNAKSSAEDTGKRACPYHACDGIVSPVRCEAHRTQRPRRRQEHCSCSQVRCQGHGHVGSQVGEAHRDDSQASGDHDPPHGTSRGQQDSQDRQESRQAHLEGGEERFSISGPSMPRRQRGADPSGRSCSVGWSVDRLWLGASLGSRVESGSDPRAADPGGEHCRRERRRRLPRRLRPDGPRAAS